MNKAAMFGLDARIALAIFGALSVISGAALYSIIQKIESSAIITELNEIEKAVEQYYLDTGTMIPVFTNGTIPAPYSYHSGALVKNIGNVNNWNGPYLPYQLKEYTNDPYGQLLDYPRAADNKGYTPDGIISILSVNADATWSAWWVTGNMNGCNSGSSCYYWAILNGFENNDILLKIDEQFDDGVSSTGNIRINYWADSNCYTLYYKMMSLFKS